MAESPQAPSVPVGPTTKAGAGAFAAAAAAAVVAWVQAGALTPEVLGLFAAVAGIGITILAGRYHQAGKLIDRATDAYVQSRQGDTIEVIETDPPTPAPNEIGRSELPDAGPSEPDLDPES